jgi:sugar diacid utilization regulator
MTLQQAPRIPSSMPVSDRELTMAGLLAENADVRRSAFREAVARRWIDRGRRTVVRAVLLDDGVGPARAAAFGRHLAAATPSPTAFVREHQSVIYLVTRDAPTSPASEIDLEGWIQHESRRLGIATIGIGSAHHEPDSDDLGIAAESARLAADLTSAVPELQPASSIDELGGWVLLGGVTAGPRHLHDISPAAEHLRTSGDSVQRETIEVYLDEGGNARSACARLHIHRTTLYYRLENMPDVVRDALDDGMKRSTLHLTLKLIRLWEGTGVL